MTTELTMFLNGRGFAYLKDTAILSLYRWHNTTSVFTRLWVILGMEFEIHVSGTRLDQQTQTSDVSDVPIR